VSLSNQYSFALLRNSWVEMSSIVRFFHLTGDQHGKLDPDAHGAQQEARAIKIVVLCSLWYLSSALSNTICMSIKCTHYSPLWRACCEYFRLSASQDNPSIRIIAITQQGTIFAAKSLLRIFPFPQTLTIVQLGSVMLYLPLHMRFFGYDHGIRATRIV
jgi:hypothetical protein